jgi:hypothetical protein
MKNVPNQTDEKGRPMTYWGGLAETKQENCCTPIGQIKRYVDCKGCDRKPKEETKQHLIDIMRGDEELGLYEEPKQETLEEAAERMYSEELTQLELLIKSQEELKDKGVLTNEGIGYLNGLKTAFNQFKNK